MSNLEKYREAFSVCFNISGSDVEGLRKMDIPAWDSVGHIGLITQIEGAFEIQMDSEDIINFESYARGKDILAAKYGIEF